MLYTEIQPQSFLASGEEDFKCFNHISAWRPFYFKDRDHLYNFSIPLNTRLHVKFEKKNDPGVSEEKSFKDVDARTDDGRRVITIAHPEPSAQMSKKQQLEIMRLSPSRARRYFFC